MQNAIERQSIINLYSHKQTHTLCLTYADRWFYCCCLWGLCRCTGLIKGDVFFCESQWCCTTQTKNNTAVYIHRHLGFRYVIWAKSVKCVLVFMLWFYSMWFYFVYEYFNIVWQSTKLSSKNPPPTKRSIISTICYQHSFYSSLPLLYVNSWLICVHVFIFRNFKRNFSDKIHA